MRGPSSQGEDRKSLSFCRALIEPRLPVFFINCFILNVFKSRCCFNNVPVCVSFVHQAHLSKDKIAKAFILRTQSLQEEENLLDL
jgi:hypothetical protein